MNELFKKRIFAYFIDALVMDFLILPLLIWSIFEEIPIIFNFIILISIYLLYFFICEFCFNKTLGKKIMNLKVENTSLTNVIKRTLARLIPFEPLSYFINEEKFWHETLSETHVILEKR